MKTKKKHGKIFFALLNPNQEMRKEHFPYGNKNIRKNYYQNVTLSLSVILCLGNVFSFLFLFVITIIYYDFYSFY